MAAMVSSSLGPMNPLLDKLPVGPEFRGLRIGLRRIKHLLLRFSAGRRGVATSTGVRLWTTLLRELVYDVEDWLDGLLLSPFGRFRLRHWPSHQLARIQEFENKIRDTCDLAVGFGVPKADLGIHVLPGGGDDDEAAAMDDDHPFLCVGVGNPPRLVGLDGPEREIAGHLQVDGRRVKTVCVLGPGGIGKTTLSAEVFRRQRGRFECGAFVHLGWHPSVYGTLMDIARQVMSQHGLLPPRDDKHVAIKLFEFLKTKRYLVVLDDVCTVPNLCTIRSVLPENDLGSRILTTTEIEKVAHSCCTRYSDFIYVMETLGDRDSTSLMLSGISGSNQEHRLPDSKSFQGMLKMCGGNPLALVVASGLFAAKHLRAELSQLDDKMFEDTVLSQLKRRRDSASSGEIRGILNISYADLSLHLKSCFLYLSAFPENYTIKKDRLVRRWIAEGLINPDTRTGKSSWEIGVSYFNELATRRLIRPVLDDDDDQPVGCRIHCVIHDFISFLSSEENFFTSGENLGSRSYPPHTIRRASLNCNKQDGSDTLATSPVRLSRVRSFTFWGNDRKWMPSLSFFKLIRVLDLQDTEILEHHQLKSIGSLLLLRYLGLQGTSITRLPKQIMALEHLSVLDIRRTMVTQLPAFRSVNLTSLLVDHLQLHRGIGAMQYLEELSMVFVAPTSLSVEVHGTVDDVAQLVNRSKKIRKLAVRFDGLFTPANKTYRQVGVMHFLNEVAKSSIQSLVLHDYPRNLVDLLVDCCAYDTRQIENLQRFELRIAGHLSKIPQKMATLIHLTHLHIKVYQLDAEGLHSLGKMPSLVLLNLTSEFGTLERCTITRDLFQCLKVLLYDSRHHGMGLQFESGAMLQLQRLVISFEPLQTRLDYGDFDFGIQYLSFLIRLHATINCWHAASGLRVEAAEAAIREQVSLIPNGPLLEFSRKEHDMIIDGKATNMEIAKATNIP